MATGNDCEYSLPAESHSTGSCIQQAATVKSEIVSNVANLFDRVETGSELDLVLAKKTAFLLASEMKEDSLAMAQLKNTDAYTFTFLWLVGDTGFEPVTSLVSTRRSSFFTRKKRPFSARTTFLQQFTGIKL